MDMSQQTIFEKATELIDAANSEDPNMESSDGREWPKELLYSYRMTDMLERFAPETDEAMKLAIRAQHIQRWKSPRDAYPMDRIGYLKWRKDLYKFHANTACQLLEQAGYGKDVIERVNNAVAKRNISSNPDTRLVEDISALVFIEHYMQAFADKHPEYSEEKWLDIICKTWKKMTDRGHAFALSGSLKLPEPLVPLIQKAVA